MNTKNIFYTFIILFISFPIYAQETKETLQKMPYDSLINLFTQYHFLDIEKAKEISQAYYKKAVLEKNDTAISQSAFLNAKVYDALSKQDSAHYFVDIFISRAKKANDDESYASGIFKKGVIYYHSRNFQEAIAYNTKAYELTKHTTKKYKLGIISNSFGLIKNQFGQRKEALDYFKESLAFFEKDTTSKKRHKGHYLNTINNLGNTYTNLSEDFPEFKKAYLDSATFYNEIGLKESTKAKDLEINTSFLTVKGIIFQKHGNLKEAHEYFIKAKKQLKKSSFNNQLALLQLYIGKNYFLSDAYDEAIEYLLKVDALAEKENITAPFFQETYVLLAKCYEKKNDQENELKYYKRFKEKDVKNDQAARKILEKLRKQYDIPSLKNKINQLENLSTEQQKRTRILFLISLGLFIALTFGFLLYRNRVKKHKQNFNAILESLKKAEHPVSKENNVSSNHIKDENIVKILQGLEKFEEKKQFLQKNCTINFVAKKIHTNKTYLSRTLQSHKQKKFVHYITDLRIDYAIFQLKNDTVFRKYDIKSIAAELGFNTSESFSKAFKKRTGIYPSFYIKNLNRLED